MAIIANEVDKILQAATTRTTNDPGAAVLLASSAPVFKVTSGGNSPDSITFTATLIALEGTVAFSIQGGTLTSITAKTAALTFANMTGDTAIVTATVISGGQTYTANSFVTKVADGTSGTVSYTWLRYGTSAAGAGITDDPTGMSYIGLAYNKSTPVESSNPADYQWSLIRGTDGEAVKGDPGTSYYTWIKYSDVADGTGLYDTPTENTMYIGIAVNKESSTESTVKTDYTWSLFKGGQGVPGLANVVIFAYQRAASPPVGSPGAVTYDFVQKRITTATLANNWLKDMPPVDGNPMYVTAATASGTGSTDAVASNEWSSAVLLAVDGASASLLSLSTVKQAFTYDSAGVASPVGQTITLTANLQNLTGTATFVCTKYNAAGTSLGTVALGGSGNVRTLTDTQFTTSAAYATVVASLGGQSDTVTIVKLADGGAGEDGVSPLARFLTNENVTVPTASDGSGANLSTVNGFFKVFQGTTDITAGCTFSIVGTPLVATTAPTAGTGAYSVTGVGTWASSSLSTSVTYRATHTDSGASVDAVLTISKAPAGIPGLNTATVRIYQRNTTGVSPALPTGNTTYTFATGVLTGLNNGWSQDLPSNGGGYLHTSAATAVGNGPTDTIAGTEWAAASLMSQDGSGTRGAGHYYASGTAWSDATADATTPGSNVTQDRVTISSGTFVMTKYWNGSSWLPDGTVIDGNLIVTNSITASKINANSLVLRSAGGTPLVGEGTPLAASLAAPGTLNSDLAPNFAAKLNKSAADILSGSISLQASGAMIAGTLTTDANGYRNGGYGVGITQRGLVAYNSSGVLTFQLNATTGSAWFAGELAAAYGTLGSLHVASGGGIHGGAFTAYSWPASGTGFYIGPEGAMFGNYNTGRFAIFTANGDIEAPDFSIINGVATFSGKLGGVMALSITDNMPAARGNPIPSGATVDCGSLTVNISSGRAPYRIQWSIASYSDSPDHGTAQVSLGGADTATVTVKIKANNDTSVLGFYVCTVVDADGKTATISTGQNVQFGTPT